MANIVGVKKLKPNWPKIIIYTYIVLKISGISNRTVFMSELRKQVLSGQRNKAAPHNT